ncbi:hypothetical protein WICPIJ_007046 [Wickerhamomyces pijperi]|uniref:Class E vacuolar protein-sorting machinery protein HSE1 n=1 Tax=Wickerhamomyces pijperi TaxID=599730 RepID=A0A9P8Q2I6_WICPI|nr:hypothetical protein WICPIJ_007046 [Wickerhamomyces pijperi]
MSSDYTLSLNKLIDKATSATLLEDNLSYILDVCDKINSDPEAGSNTSIETIKLKLSSTDGNVQLRTLSLLTSIAENCGSRVRQLIATKHFTGLLVAMINNTAIHKQIKVKIVQVMQQLSDSFKSDPSLKPMELALKDVKLSFPVYFTAPAKPAKTQQQYSEYDEEQLLQQALKASEEEYQQQLKRTAATATATNTAPAPPPSRTTPSEQPQQQQQSPAPRTFSRVRALYDSTSNDPEDLQFQKGDIITILDREYSDWCKGSLRGVIGLFPFNYVTPLYDPTAEELAEETKRETEVLSKSKDIETLLSILTQASNNESNTKYQALDDDRFKKLYQSVIGVKPELAVLIDKYSQRQSDLTDLHQRLKNAGNIYEELNDHTRYHQQQRRQQQQQPYYPPAPVNGYAPPQVTSPQPQPQQQQYYQPYPAQQQPAQQQQQYLQSTQSLSQQPTQTYQNADAHYQQPTGTVSYQTTENGQHAPYPQ